MVAHMRSITERLLVGLAAWGGYMWLSLKLRTIMFLTQCYAFLGYAHIPNCCSCGYLLLQCTKKRKLPTTFHALIILQH